MKNILTIFFVFALFMNGVRGQNCSEHLKYEGEGICFLAPTDICGFNCVQWYKDGVPIVTPDGAFHYDLTYNSLTVDHSGTYTYEFNCPNAPIVDTCFVLIVNEEETELEGKLYTRHLIVDYNNTSLTPAQVADSLLSQDFKKIDSCLCSPPLELWEYQGSNPNVEGKVNAASGSLDEDGTRNGRNFFMDYDPPAYCLSGEMYSWPRESTNVNSYDPIVIAIIDNGIRKSEITRPFWLRPTNDTLLNCLGGSSNEMNGYNALSPMDTIQGEEHGTIVAHIIESFSPNSIPIEFMNIKVKSESGRGSLFDFVCGLRYAIDSGAKIINVSMGYYGRHSPLLESIIVEAHKKGIVVITSAGNKGEGRNNHWPSGFYNYSLLDNNYNNYDNVIRVGAVDNSNDIASFSGKAEFYAFGQNLSYNNQAKSGTSYSAAFITAVVAKILAENSLSMSPSSIINELDGLTSLMGNGKRMYKVEPYYVGSVNSSTNTIILDESMIIDDTRLIEASLEIGASCSLTNTANVVMRSAGKIHLLPGFTSEEGSFLHAYIEKCDDTDTNARSSNPTEDLVDDEKSKAVLESKIVASSSDLKIIPNPFQGQTTIEYTLEQPAKVELHVFNTLGEKVRTLVNDYQEQGTYEALFQGEELASGMYFATLRIGNDITTRRMVLQKM